MSKCILRSEKIKLKKMEATLNTKNIIKEFFAVSATVSLIAGVCNYTNSHYLPTTTDDGVVSNRDSIPTLVIPDVRLENQNM